MGTSDPKTATQGNKDRVQSAMIEFAALWMQKGKSGGEYLAGTLNKNVRIYVLKNKHKKSAAEPDYHIMLKPSEPKNPR
jgi:uncharacterized protein (DUF736 family)